MKYTKKERLSIYRKMRKYIKKQFLVEDIYLCAILEHDILHGEGNIEEFPELMDLRPQGVRTSAPWWSDRERKEGNTFRLDAINKVIADMTKSRTKKSISK